ncbi:hypothetical protein [Phorcysia thermohydrogeniphila]|uniref:Thymidylate kinase n=1 Tax=Phorcysia thermohydrogeniphila TaxID=936138 RepID=A0A4R1GCJ3_9BACT|nr:hypothetical protein [Phorcysia thermohydrogeniphila]TCK04451.1 thymidylate kinase [Phorcysia thermohydrogeniphila]
MIVAIVGPDGSGKSTVARKLVKELEDTIYIYLGHGKERKYCLSKFNRKLLNVKFLGRFLKLIDDILIISKMKLDNDKLYVTDRWIVDLCIQSESKFKRAIFFAIFRLLPKPDIFVLLVGEPEKIFQRKSELPVEKIRKQINDYKKMLIKYNLLIFDTTLESPMHIVNLVKKEIETAKGGKQ